ncbi:MAG: hypothetical protein ACRD1K_20725 [Acidimicrobiales bacterium]
MTQLTFRVDQGAKVVRQSLEHLRGDIPKIGRQSVYETMQRIVRIMKPYPPPPPGSTYRRTMRLKGSWRIQAAGATGYTVKNIAARRGRRYSVYVIGDASGKRQAGIHAGRWKLLRFVAENEVRKMPKAIIEHMRASGKPLRFA